ncbi:MULTISPECIES: FAD-dependent oxidoreductase [Brevibacterium]|uniref:Reductase C-terminal n=2 Tax=Brevibacterium antiquum TaxID=234835 RepID=A0A2H1HU30_9MICO|nr:MULTISPECIES: FAD-dependent oxidoreductase [Brevibacterium]SMX66414.1 Reductase C-terminal [Brevibacterium antiquum CNRZ 918]SMX90722.1 Reductase C-terminal [Brevibacterium antiquum]HCG56317.1 ferredoxin reductase [Brevibacterium sp.]
MAQEFGTVIIGAGIGGGTAIEALRDGGYTASIALIGAEPAAPYYRPDLSKKVMLEGSDPAESALRGADWYPAHDVTTFFGTTVTELDAENQSITLDNGENLAYGQIILATGSTPRTLDVPGADLGNIHTLRDSGDAVAIRSQFGQGSKVVIIGGGWVGLEVAAAAQNAGCDVTVVLRSNPPLKSALGTEIGQYFEELHRSKGIEFVTDADTTGFSGTKAVEFVQTSAGDLPADLVVVGIGADPTIELASSVGVDTDNGVVVDEHMRSSDPSIFAIGDIAAAQNTLLKQRLRVEHWDNAVRQAEVAAATITGGDKEYDWQPYFYTDQYDLGMEYVGHGASDDDVVIRGDKFSGEFIVFWTRGGTVTAAMNVNIWDVGDELRALIGRSVSAARLQDESIDIQEL